MAYTAKSVILDIADNRSGANYITLRSIDFWFEGSKITMLPADFTAYATTEFSATYAAEQAFDTSLSKIGDYADLEWLCANLTFTNQRLIIVFDTAQTFDSIVVNNGHLSGAWTDRGVKNVKINISTDAITSTVYDEAIANATLIYDGLFDEHAATNLQDDQILSLGTAGVSGIITENGSPVARTVRAYDRDTGAFIAGTTSSAVDGSYSIDTGTATEVFVIAFDDDAGTVYNAVILDKIIPN